MRKTSDSRYWTELISGVGAGVLGLGLGVQFSEYFKGYGLTIIDKKDSILPSFV